MSQSIFAGADLQTLLNQLPADWALKRKHHRWKTPYWVVLDAKGRIFYKHWSASPTPQDVLAGALQELVKQGAEALST